MYEACLTLKDLTSGAFNPFYNGSFNPVAYVKGWAIGVASDMLLHNGLTNHMVNAGGDIVARGSSDEDSDGWMVGIQHPFVRQQIFCSVNLVNESIATSGLYERGNHIVSNANLDSVSVIGPDPGFTDALSTAVFVHGLNLPLPAGYDVCGVSNDEVLVSSQKFILPL